MKSSQASHPSQPSSGGAPEPRRPRLPTWGQLLGLASSRVLVGLASLSLASFGLAACNRAKPAPVGATPAAAARVLDEQPAAAPSAITAPGEVPATALAFFKIGLTEFTSPKNPITDAKIVLGRQLYYETRLSKNQDLSCASCHDLTRGGVDGEKTSKGHRGQRGDRNSPTVLNAAGNIAQFWDGRAEDVEAQAKGPILNPVEMAVPSAEKAVAVLKSIPGYTPLFQAAFPGTPDPITWDNVALAIGAFERRLATPSRFDRYLGGERSALALDERRGLVKFVETGCTACHFGPNIGGSMYQKAGLVKPWPNQADPGRYKVTKAEAERMVFRVPSLRNVAMTAPYFHDGDTPDLGAAVKRMGEYQLGKSLSDEDTRLIVEFLRTLSGTVDAAYIAKPAPLAAGPTTPAPDPT
jgi:cytochrome c peroxidase